MDDLEIYELILSKDLTWEGLLRDIVETEDVNPWDIDVDFLASKYQEALKSLQSVDFRLSGKFLLAAAILLKMKSDNFEIEEVYDTNPMNYFEDFFADLELDSLSTTFREQELQQNFKESEVTVDVQLPRKRVKPINLDDLVDALKDAMEVKERREERKEDLKQRMNYKANTAKINIKRRIEELYENIVHFFENLRREEIGFKELIPSQDKEDVIWTFVPLLHLNNEGKISLHQKVQFGEIKIKKPKTV